MRLAVLGSLAAVAATAVAADQYHQEDEYYSNEDYIPENEDPYSSRSLATSPVPYPVVAMLTMLNFFNALQESWAEEDDELGRDGDMNDGSKISKWSSNVWRAVKGVPTVLYETSAMVAPLTLRYMISDENENPDCQNLMMCELNVRMKERFGKPGEIAMQLASSMAGYALGGKDPQRYDSLYEAARQGRRGGKECQSAYPNCVARSDASAVPALFNLATRIIQSSKNKDKGN